MGDQSYNDCYSVDNEVESHACNDHAHDLFPKVTDFRKQHQSNFIFAHINMNSYRHKFVYVSALLSKRKADYLAVSETKLDASFPLAQFSVDRYVV